MPEQADNESRARTILWIVGAVLALAVVWLLFAAGAMTPGGGGGAAGLDPQLRERVRSHAASDMAAFQARDYPATYRSLTNTDKAEVTEAEWVNRCRQVEKAAGRVASYTVGAVTYLDTGHSVLAVDLAVQFAKATKPRRSTLFYVEESGEVRQTMLWGRTLKVAATQP